jgi:hypothetical protein
MQANINPLLRTELIEIEIANAAGTEFSLGQLPNLRTAKTIFKIEAFNASQIAFSPKGKAVVNTTAFNKASIKLINGNDVEFRHIALQSLSKTVNGTTIENINTPQIDTEKSKIVVGNPTGVVAGEVFLLQITYEKAAK